MITSKVHARNSERKNPKKAFIRTARFNAKKRGLEFTITAADIEFPETCPVLGIPITLVGERNNMPSIDRIDNAFGYIPGNVIVVSWRANWLKANATAEELTKLAKFFSKIKYVAPT